jgi:superfamily II DNA or RNA helicase
LTPVLEKADSTSLGSFLPVTVGSVQSLAQEKRLPNFPDNYFQDIIVDEAHHCTSDSYLRVLNHFPGSQYPRRHRYSGSRGHEKPRRFLRQQGIRVYSMTDAIREGYLCPIKAQMIPLKSRYHEGRPFKRRLCCR